jgi:maleate isomerase
MKEEKVMTTEGSRGTVGIVRPTQRTGGYVELLDMLPAGIRLIPICLDVRRGAYEEFKSAIPAYEEKVGELSRMGISIINASGIPPFMLLGYANEQDLIRTWEEKYRARIFTSGTSNVDAMRAYGVTRMLGVTYFSGDINTIFAKYFDDAGFECLDMAHMEGIPFDKVPELPSAEVYDFTMQAFRQHPSAQGIYMLGPAWHTLDIIERLESECGVPVFNAVPVQCWDIQRHLGVREPVKGYGRLMAEMPDGVTMATRKLSA